MKQALRATSFLTLALALAGPALAAPKPVAKPAPAAAPAPVAAPAPISVALPAGQLTDAARPTAYRLDLTVDPDKTRFSGHVEVDAVLKAPSRTVVLHGRDLAMHKVFATVGGKQLPGTWVQGDPTGVGAVSFAEELPAGAVTLSFDYDAAFGEGPAGMFRVKVGDDWYSWTQLQSIDGRAAFPSFDEPGFKVPFTVTLRTKPGQVAVSNTPEVSKTLENGLEVHRFAQTLPLPTYLVAMFVGPFVTVEGTVPPTPQRANPLPLRVVSTRQNAGKLDFALDGSKGIVTLLEDYFGQAFPYPKLDQVTTPILPGAMENAGADLYNDAILVMDKDAPVDQKRSFGMIVSHELGHQWFGDLVTPAWWDDIWLNESFANWIGYRIGNAWRPDLNIGAGALAEGFGAMGTDALLAGRPIHQKIEKNAQIDAAFDNITYGKGGHVVAMIAAFMGDTKFRDGVRAYMAAHRNGNATSADFFRAMAEVSGDPRILPAMQSFTDQQGVPLVTFERSKGGYTVTQSRFVRMGTPAPEMRWGIPLCVRQGAESRCELLADKSMPFALKGKGVAMPNAGGTGYYRFELPKKDWDRLIATSATLSGGEALALADSLRASFMAGRAKSRQLTTLARTMIHNPDSYAASTAMDTLGLFGSLDLLDDKATASLRAFSAQLVRPMLAQYGFDPRQGAYAAEPAERVQRRVQIVGRLAGGAHDPVLRKQLADAATAYLAGDTKALDSMWFGNAFDALVDAGGMPTAKSLLEKALTSQDPVFRPQALLAVGTSGKADIAKWVLDDVRDPRLRVSERLNLVRFVIGNPATRDMGYDWMKSHFAELTSGSGGIFFSSRLPQVLAGFCSAERADEFAREFRPRFAGLTGALELERTIERVRSCGTLKAARRAEASAEIAKLK